MSAGSALQPCRVVIVGMMGSGKSTIGKRLSEATGWPRYDNDKLLEQLFGMTAREILAARGEQGMRDAEDAALTHGLQADPPCIVEAAAGTILSEASRDALRGAVVVWLRASPEALYRRSVGAAHRPWLDGGEDWVRTTALDRHDLYASVADIQVDTDDRSPREATEGILARLDDLCRDGKDEHHD